MKYKAHSLFPIPVLDSTIEVSPKIINYVHSLVYERTDYDNADISVSKNILDNVLLKTYSDKIDSLVNEFVFEVCKFDRKKLSLKRTAPYEKHQKNLRMILLKYVPLQFHLYIELAFRNLQRKQI